MYLWCCLAPIALIDGDCTVSAAATAVKQSFLVMLSPSLLSLTTRPVSYACQLLFAYSTLCSVYHCLAASFVYHMGTTWSLLTTSPVPNHQVMFYLPGNGTNRRSPNESQCSSELLSAIQSLCTYSPPWNLALPPFEWFHRRLRAHIVYLFFSYNSGIFNALIQNARSDALMSYQRSGTTCVHWDYITLSTITGFLVLWGLHLLLQCINVAATNSFFVEDNSYRLPASLRMSHTSF